MLCSCEMFVVDNFNFSYSRFARHILFLYIKWVLYINSLSESSCVVWFYSISILLLSLICFFVLFGKNSIIFAFTYRSFLNCLFSFIRSVIFSTRIWVFSLAHQLVSQQRVGSTRVGSDKNQLQRVRIKIGCWSSMSQLVTKIKRAADTYCKKISKYKETAEKIRKRLVIRSSPYHDGQLWSNAKKNSRKS